MQSRYHIRTVADLSKNIARYPVKQFHFTFWGNLGQIQRGLAPAYPLPGLNKGQWQKVYFTKSRIELVERNLSTKHGALFEYTLNSFLPGEFSELSVLLSKITTKPHILLVELENGQRILLGNEYVGASFSYQQSNTALGASLRWEVADTESAFVLSIPDAVVNGFNYTFNFQFNG